MKHSIILAVLVVLAIAAAVLVGGCGGGDGLKTAVLQIWQGIGAILHQVANPNQGETIQFRFDAAGPAVPVQITGAGGFMVKWDVAPYTGIFGADAKAALPLTVKSLGANGLPDGIGEAKITAILPPTITAVMYKANDDTRPVAVDVKVGDFVAVGLSDEDPLAPNRADHTYTVIAGTDCITQIADQPEIFRCDEAGTVTIRVHRISDGVTALVTKTIAPRF